MMTPHRVIADKAAARRIADYRFVNVLGACSRRVSLLCPARRVEFLHSG
jgi:hypothetical protein